VLERMALGAVGSGGVGGAMPDTLLRRWAVSEVPDTEMKLCGPEPISEPEGLEGELVGTDVLGMLLPAGAGLGGSNTTRLSSRRRSSPALWSLLIACSTWRTCLPSCSASHGSRKARMADLD
jgi:hypothetical protein